MKADTAAARSASDIGTRTGSTTVIDAVREPCPPKSTLEHELLNHAPATRIRPYAARARRKAGKQPPRRHGH